MGGLHARALSEAELASLVAVVDPDERIGTEVADRWRSAWYPNVETLLEKVEFDVAVVAVPDTEHERPVVELLGSGKSVLVEKPLAHNLDAARNMVAASRRRGRLMVGHILRFDPRYRIAAETVAAGTIGAPAHVATRRFNWTDVGKRLRGRSSTCFYLGIHDADATQWVTCKRIQRVVAHSTSVIMRHNGVESEDAIYVTSALEDGVLGSMQFGWSLPPTAPSGILASLEIMGTAGMLSLDASEPGVRVSGSTRTDYPDGMLWPIIGGRITGDLAAETDHFLRSVLKDSEFVISLDDAASAVAVNDAVLRSLASGGWEEVADA